MQLASLNIKRNQALLCNQLILGAKPVDKVCLFMNVIGGVLTHAQEDVSLYSFTNAINPFSLPMKLLPCSTVTCSNLSKYAVTLKV